MKKSNLHEEYYNFRNKVWKQFEQLVKTGSNNIGEFPIIVGEIEVRDTIIQDTDNILIYGILKDDNYSINIRTTEMFFNTTKIKVLVNKFNSVAKIIEVEPNIQNLQELSTYISGGLVVYDKK